MLRAKAVPEILGQIVGDGVSASLLMTLEGSLIGAAGSVDSADHKVVGAIASHTWGEYLHAGKDFSPAGSMRTLIVELEHGRVAISRAGKGFLVCAYSDGEAQPGLLKAKVEALGSHLASSLDLVNV